MTRPLLTRTERRYLSNNVLFFLARRAVTARQIADYLQVTVGRVHSVLVCLRAEGVIEVIGIATPDEPPRCGELVWGLTSHGQYHGVDEAAPPGSHGCRHCRRSFAEW